MDIKLLQQIEKERKGEKGQMGGTKEKEMVGKREKIVRYGGMIFYKVSFIMVLHNKLLQVLLMFLFI
jgi:hypothetical protein